jgi:hypothetical protein
MLAVSAYMCLKPKKGMKLCLISTYVRLKREIGVWAGSNVGFKHIYVLKAKERHEIVPHKHLCALKERDRRVEKLECRP